MGILQELIADVEQRDAWNTALIERGSAAVDRALASLERAIEVLRA